MTKIRTRFAPSPTGRMHVGNLRTALYAYLIAKHEGGDFILRIEDTDQERFVEGAVEIINRTLEKTGLIHDEGPDKDGGVGPYVQSQRQAEGIYLEYARKLIEKGEAYYCFCDKKRLATLNQVVAGKEINVYDKHCLSLSKEEVAQKLAHHRGRQHQRQGQRNIQQPLDQAGSLGGVVCRAGAQEEDGGCGDRRDTQGVAQRIPVHRSL